MQEIESAIDSMNYQQRMDYGSQPDQADLADAKRRTEKYQKARSNLFEAIEDLDEAADDWYSLHKSCDSDNGDQAYDAYSDAFESRDQAMDIYYGSAERLKGLQDLVANIESFVATEAERKTEQQAGKNKRRKNKNVIDVLTLSGCQLVTNPEHDYKDPLSSLSAYSPNQIQQKLDACMMSDNPKLANENVITIVGCSAVMYKAENIEPSARVQWVAQILSAFDSKTEGAFDVQEHLNRCVTQVIPD